MQISKISTPVNYKPVFKAHLYYLNQNIPDQYFEFNKISEKGNENTNIFVHDIKSNNFGYEYHNSTHFAINNPFLGYKDFFVKNTHTTNTDIIQDKMELIHNIYNYFTEFNTLENLENETLKLTLLKTVNKAARYNSIHYTNKEETNPEKILAEMIKEQNPQLLGFSPERIRDFKNVAKELNNELMLLGSYALLDKE